MKACVQFRLEKCIHRSMPIQPAHAGKLICNDADSHVSLTRSGHVGLMACMLMALIDNDQPLRTEVVLQGRYYSGSEGHFRSVVKHWDEA